MADPFVAEIRIFPFNFAPRGWATCDGQLIPLAQNTALYSLLGTSFGGDGRMTFALPNLQGSAPMGYGQGPGLSDRSLGEVGGTATVALLETEIPSHTHVAQGSSLNAVGTGPVGMLAAVTPSPEYAPASGATVDLHPSALGVVGGSQPHENMQPYLTLNFCIALAGVFPPR